MPTAKSERIDIRVTPEQKERIERAASLQGMSVSAFLALTADEAAKTAIGEAEHQELSGQDREIFFDALLNPPAPSDKLKEASKRYKKTLMPNS